MKTERVVLDTNVLISAVISRAGKPRKCVELGLERGCLVSAPRLFDEFETRVLRPRIARLTGPAATAAFVAALRAATEFVAPAPIEPTCRDPDDDIVLATALAADADCIVTGDQDLLVLDPFRGIRILTPAAFLDAVAAADDA